MRITRNGMIVDLTNDELREAYEEFQHESDIADIRYIIEEGYKCKGYDMSSITEKEIEQMAQLKRKLLSEDDCWRTASRDAIFEILNNRKN